MTIFHGLHYCWFHCKDFNIFDVISMVYKGVHHGRLLYWQYWTPISGNVSWKIAREEREKQLAPSNVVSIAMVYDSKECQNKTYENYIYVNHIYVCSIAYTFVSHCQGPATRYEQNLKLTNEEEEESERTVKSQKRQIEALQSQLGEINAPKRFTLTNIKVGTSLLKWKCTFSFKWISIFSSRDHYKEIW